MFKFLKMRTARYQSIYRSSVKKFEENESPPDLQILVKIEGFTLFLLNDNRSLLEHYCINKMGLPERYFDELYEHAGPFSKIPLFMFSMGASHNEIIVAAKQYAQEYFNGLHKATKINYYLADQYLGVQNLKAKENAEEMRNQLINAMTEEYLKVLIARSDSSSTMFDYMDKILRKLVEIPENEPLENHMDLEIHHDLLQGAIANVKMVTGLVI